MSCPLKNTEFKYSNLDKQSFALIKAVKKFCHYILRSKVYAIVPDPVVKTLLMQNEPGERRGKWMAILQEFDLEIQSMRLVRGQGLSKMIADYQDEDEKDFKFDDDTSEDDQKRMLVSQVDVNQGVIIDVWYQDILYYLLQNRCPDYSSQ